MIKNINHIMILLTTKYSTIGHEHRNWFSLFISGILITIDFDIDLIYINDEINRFFQKNQCGNRPHN